MPAAACQDKELLKATLIAKTHVQTLAWAYVTAAKKNAIGAILQMPLWKCKQLKQCADASLKIWMLR